MTTRSRVGLLIGVLGALLACREGGANMGQRAPGDQPGGVTLGLGDIAVAPDDDFVIFERDDTLAVGWTENGNVEPLPIEEPTRLAFSKKRSVVYVGSTEPFDRIVAFDLERRTELWSSRLDDVGTFTLRLTSSKRDDYLVAVDAPEGVVSIIDTTDGRVLKTHRLGDRVVDAQILPDDERALVVLDHVWQDEAVTTRVALLPLAGGPRVELEIPNCADRVAVSGDGKRAFMAPTTCVEPSSARAKDPISLIELEPGRERFVRNLPGFGPVAVSPGGNTAVGFLDREAIDTSLFDDESLIPPASSDRYHLMLLDTATLEYEFVEVGSRLPRFAITPDGNVLLVDSNWTLDVPARLFDVGSKEWRYISGAPLKLDNFVITSDSSHAYVIEERYFEGLYDLDIAGGTSTEIELPFAPRNINISTSDQTLYLRRTDDDVCVFSLETRRCESTLSARPLVAGG